MRYGKLGFGVCVIAVSVSPFVSNAALSASFDPVKVPAEVQTSLPVFASTAAPTGSMIPGGPVFGTFDIVLSGIGSVSPSLQAAFTDAEQFWEAHIQGYRSSAFSGVNQLVIDVTVEMIDGVGSILGSAGPSSVAFDLVNELIVPTSGGMRFDIADAGSLFANGKWDDVIRHEMGHVIGFGSLWSRQVEFTDGNGNVVDTATFNDVLDENGNYVGQFGLDTYNQEFGLNLASILVEDDGGPGTAGGHWEEGTGGEISPFPDRPGFAGADELMTGFINTSAGAPDTWVAETTLASFADLGYSVQLQALPVPAGVWLMLSGLAALSAPRLLRPARADRVAPVDSWGAHA